MPVSAVPTTTANAPQSNARRTSSGDATPPSRYRKRMAGQTPAILHWAEMRLMDERREASLFARDRCRGEIDDPALVLEIVNAMAFRA